MIHYIITPSTLVFVHDGKTITLSRDCPQSPDIIAELRMPCPNETRLLELIDLATAVNLYSDRDVTMAADGSVMFKGTLLPAVLANKVVQCYKDRVPYRHLLNFFDRLSKNPSNRAVTELYKFMEHMSMPITPEGHLLAYKGVGENYLDIWSGKFPNHPGCEHSMPRNEVNDDANVGCAVGWHVGSYDYATGWAGDNGHVMIVDVDPADVVSIPHDCSWQKMRTCRYKVVCESRGKLSDSGVEDAQAPYQPSADQDDEPATSVSVFLHAAGSEPDKVKAPVPAPAKVDPKVIMAREAGKARAERLRKVGVVVKDTDAFFTARSRRYLRDTYGSAAGEYIAAFKKG